MAERSNDVYDVSNLIGEINNLEGTSVAPDLNDIIELIRSEDVKIITFTGAGISTSAGIPDFRSENGLYNIIKSKFDMPNPELIFDFDYFKKDPKLFYCIAKQFIEVEYLPTKTHCFLKLLHNKKLLLRNFTQNVDGLDSKVGLSNKVNIECHGHFKTGHCLSCSKKYSYEEMKAEISNHDYITCNIENCRGLVKPDIVLFGESLPKTVFENLSKISEANLIIIMGSSLRVMPFNQFINFAKKETPYLIINNEDPLGGMALYSGKKYLLQLPCDEGIKKICELLNWTSELEEIYSQFH
nr:sirtuin-2-like protein [Dugesia japonica]